MFFFIIIIKFRGDTWTPFQHAVSACAAFFKSDHNLSHELQDRIQFVVLWGGFFRPISEPYGPDTEPLYRIRAVSMFRT